MSQANTFSSMKPNTKESYADKKAETRKKKRFEKTMKLCKCQHKEG